MQHVYQFHQGARRCGGVDRCAYSVGIRTGEHHTYLAFPGVPTPHHVPSVHTLTAYDPLPFAEKSSETAEGTRPDFSGLFHTESNRDI